MSINTEDGPQTALQCRQCQEIFMIPSRRGRPPVYCDICVKNGASLSESARERLIAAANKRVDNLDMMLRSRNLHIQQHTKDD